MFDTVACTGESNPLLIQFDASNHSVVGCQWFDQVSFMIMMK